MTNCTPKKRDWKHRFLENLAGGKYPNVSAAARTVGIARNTAYTARANDPGFAAAWDDIIEESLDRLEEQVYERASEGKSDLLMMFWLKAYRPARFRENYTIEHTGRENYEIVYVNDWRNAGAGSDE